MWISVLVLREVFVKSTLESADMRIFSDDRPDIQRCGEGEDQAGEQDAWRGEFKLPVLAILKICRTDPDKKQDGEDHIAHGKHHIVDHRLDLSFGGVPSVFNCSRYIARSESGLGKGRHKDGHEQKGEKDSCWFLFHKRLPPITF